MFFSTRKFLSLLPSLAFIIFTSHVSAQEPEKLSEVLLQLRNHIEQGKMTEALELLDKGQVAAALLENENLNLHEEFLWEASMANLDFANELRNREQYVEYARRAKERWKDYINWFHQLSQEDKGRLSSSHDRINKATTHLGNSILRMHAPRDIFTEYAEIPDAGYLSTVSFTIWKQWLYACPDMRTVKSNERTPTLRKQKICNVDCTEFWLDYADALEEWAKDADISDRIRRKKIREVQQIRQAAESCQN